MVKTSLWPFPVLTSLLALLNRVPLNSILPVTPILPTPFRCFSQTPVMERRHLLPNDLKSMKLPSQTDQEGTQLLLHSDQEDTQLLLHTDQEDTQLSLHTDQEGTKWLI